VPFRIAAEEFAVPPHGAGIQRLLLGLRNLRQDFAEEREQAIQRQREENNRRNREYENLSTPVHPAEGAMRE
ncbi:MAG: hypothetical protein EBU01_09435, partial [Crocinitomicaceae bacterium]|nr:hypothetical protein [Crocinitomicaceae bacterium]